MLLLLRPSKSSTDAAVVDDTQAGGYLVELYLRYQKLRKEQERESKHEPEEAAKEIISEVEAIIEEAPVIVQTIPVFQDYREVAAVLTALRAEIEALTQESLERERLLREIKEAERKRAEIALKILLEQEEEEEALFLFLMDS